MTAHVAPERLEAASGPERGALLEHVRGCAACRAELAAAAPERLFALLALAPVPAPVLEAVSREVRAGAAASRAAATPLARRLAAAAVLAFAALTGSLTLLGPAPPTPVARAVRADVEVAPTAAVSGVVDFTVGTTQVVMVYNGDLNL